MVYPTGGTSGSSTSTTPTEQITPVETVPQPATQYSGVKLGSSSKDERGQYRGGQAGD